MRSCKYLVGFFIVNITNKSNNKITELRSSNLTKGKSKLIII